MKHLKILIFSTLMLSLLPLSNALAAEPTRTGFQNDNVKAVDAYFTNLYGVGLLVTGDTLFVKPSKYGNAADSTWYATIDANGNPMNGFVDAAGNLMTVTGAAAQMQFDSATEGYAFSDEIIQGIQSDPYDFSADTGTTYNHNIYAWSNSVSGGENYKAMNVTVIDSTDATDTNWQGVKAGDFRTYKKIGLGIAASPYSTGTELWGTQSVVDISGVTTVRNMFGAAGTATVNVGGSVIGHTLNPGVVSAGFFTGFVDGAATLTDVLDVPLIGQIGAQASNARAKADAAIGAMLIGASGDPSTDAVSAFRVFDVNSADNFDYGLDFVWTEGGYGHTQFDVADIRFSGGETIDAKEHGKIRVRADSLALAMSAFSDPSDSLLLFTLPSGVPTITGLATDGDTSNISWNTADQIVLTGATGGYTFDNEVIQGIQSVPYDFSADTGTTFNHQIYAWSNAVAGGENYKAINVTVVDSTDATDTNWQGIKAGDFRTYKKIGLGIAGAPYSTGTELWGTQSVVDISGVTTVRNMFGSAGSATANTGTSVIGHTLNPAVVTGGFFKGFVDAGATLTDAIDSPLIGQVEAQASNPRAKADAAVGAMLIGASGDPSTTAVSAFRVFDANSTDDFDFHFDSFWDETGWGNIGSPIWAEIRMSQLATIDNKNSGAIRFAYADSLILVPTAFSVPNDSTLALAINSSGNPFIGLVDAAGNVMTVTGEADSIKVAGHDALILDTGLLIQHDGTMPVWGHSPTGAAIEGIVEINGASYLDGLLTVAGAFTSPGIDDNADDIAITIDVTTEKVTFSADAEVTATLTYAVAHADTTHHGAVTDGSTMYYDTTLNALVFTGW